MIIRPLKEKNNDCYFLGESPCLPQTGTEKKGQGGSEACLDAFMEWKYFVPVCLWIFMDKYMDILRTKL